MDFKMDDYQKAVELHIEEWSRRSTSPMIQEYGKGCFVWDSKKDGERGSGMFYALDMVEKYFPGKIGEGLKKMIEEAHHEHEVVVALVFDEKAIGLRLWKFAGKYKGEVVPPLVH